MTSSKSRQSPVTKVLAACKLENRTALVQNLPRIPCVQCTIIVHLNNLLWKSNLLLLHLIVRLLYFIN